MLTVSEALDLRAGKKLVFTNGVFDILHAGHVAYLTEARSLGDLLIIGLNDDESVRQLNKGPGRPINPLLDRAFVLEALRVVDGVVAFSDSEPSGLIAQLKPEVHVKGGDYVAEEMPEYPVVKGYGGEVVILQFLEGRSTTSILERLRE